MEFSKKILIFLTSFRQHVLSLPVLFIILLSLFLIVPETSQSPNIAYYPQHSQYHPRIFPTTKVKLKVPDSPANSVKHLEILQSIPDLSTNQLLQSVGNLHRSYFEKKKNQFFNERMRRIIMMFMQFESISRQIFNRGTVSLPTQTDLEGLADHVVESRWYREALNRISSNNAYGFSEERMLRVLMSIHTAAHFFEVPYPTLFCLFFQESKFDFLANSATGAKGIGQLTSIGLREVQRLRNASEMELKLQKTAFHLNRVYTDPQIQKWLENLGFKINFAKISPIPEKIEFTRLSSSFMREVGKELVKEGQSYGENTSLLWFLSKRLRRGDILSNRFAHMHKVFSQMLEEQYARSQASAYNIETNILLSTILFSHYYRYRWRNNKQVFNLPPEARVILATSAYNHGQTGMRRFLINLKQEFPMLDFQALSSKKLRILFTIRRLSNAIKQSPRKIKEVSRHVRNIMDCAENRTVSPRVL